MVKLHTSSFGVVWDFEERVAEITGAKHAVAVDCCTNALFLALVRTGRVGDDVRVPAHTYVSVPMTIIHAGLRPRFYDTAWRTMYELGSYRIYDAALSFYKGMYAGGTMCLSFQARKPLPIGRGGMILTDDAADAKWYRAARACGRNPEVAYADDRIKTLGWNMIMTPEQAARGMLLLDSGYPHTPTIEVDFPDLRKMPVFREYV